MNKFTIKEKMQNLSQNQAELIKNAIVSACGIHPRTFDRWLNAPLESQITPNIEYLLIIADCLNCNIDDLINKTDLRVKANPVMNPNIFEHQ